MFPPEEIDELLAILDTGSSAVTILEVGAGRAIVGPVVEGVAAFLPLSEAVWLSAAGHDPVCLKAGQVALCPTGVAATLSVEPIPRDPVESHDMITQRDGWIVAGPTSDEEPVVAIVATRIAGSAAAGLSRIAVSDVARSREDRAIFRALRDEFARGAHGHPGFVMALMQTCVMQAARQLRTKTRRAARSGGSAMPAVAVIRAQPGAEHDLAALADAAGMSRATFLRRFTATAGASPQSFIRRMRLREAAIQLTTTRLPIKAIAATCGFASRSHFSRSFRDAYDCDPSTYRRRAAE